MSNPSNPYQPPRAPVGEPAPSLGVPVGALTEADYIWVAIRVLGLYLLLQAVFSAVRLAASVLALAVTAPLGDTASFLIPSQVSGAAGALIAVVAYVLLGRYLVQDGRRVFEWVASWRS